MSKQTVYIYRAVMEAEKQQIEFTGTFENPQGIENKYFAIAENGACTYAKLAYLQFGDDSPYWILRVEVSSTLLTGMLTVDVNITTVVLGSDQLLGLIPEFLNACMRPTR